MVNPEKELALAGDTEKELLKKPSAEQVTDKDLAEEASVLGSTADDARDDDANDADTDSPEVDEDGEEGDNYESDAEPSKLSKVLHSLPRIPEFPIAKSAAEVAGDDEAADKSEAEEDPTDIVNLEKSDKDYLFSTSDPMIDAPSAEDMEDLTGTDRGDNEPTEEEQEEDERRRLESLEKEEKEEATTDEYLFGMRTDGTTGGSGKPKIKRITKYTVALKKAEDRKRQRGGGASLSELDREMGF